MPDLNSKPLERAGTWLAAEFVNNSQTSDPVKTAQCILQEIVWAFQKIIYLF